ncbi:MAG: hypothetical protein J6X03_00730 [Bacilli bacterium]|nr:hypothetical protein [Bacilli bacterium]
MKLYTITFSYPDGHSEEIEENFTTLKEAVNYGINLLNQVRATEETKSQGLDDFEEKRNAFFSVHEVDGDVKRIVFNS